MPFAVTLRLDPAGSARVAAMRTAMVHPPHITLAVFGDDIDGAALADELRSAVAAWAPVRLSFAGFGLFPGEPAVLWLVPAPSAQLLERQIRIAKLGAADAVHPHYRPDAWVPHLTLAEDLALDAAIDALRICSLDWRPFAADLDQVELVKFPPVCVLWSQSLL